MHTSPSAAGGRGGVGGGGAGGKAAFADMLAALANQLEPGGEPTHGAAPGSADVSTEYDVLPFCSSIGDSMCG